MCPLNKNSTQKSLAMEIASASIALALVQEKDIEWFVYHLCFFGIYYIS